MENTLTLGLLATYVGLLLLDFVVPARVFPTMRLWRLKGLAYFVIGIALFTMLPLVWGQFISQFRLIDGSGLGIGGGAIVGLVVVQFFAYWWHRTMHRTPFLWRWFHQMHHSAERMDVFSAFIFHPLDVVGFSFVGSFALGVVIGLRPEAALLTGTVGTFLAFFNHSNIRTPQWLGYFIQRPENHSLHHERGVHGFNYGDISLWDMVFGTFRNPKTWEGQAGFYDGASERIGEMLIGRDVSKPKLPQPRASAPSTPDRLEAAA